MPPQAAGRLLSHAVFLQGQGPGWSGHSQAACGGYSPPPVREAAKSVLWQASCKKPQTIKTRPGGFRLLGELLLLRIRQESSGGWRVLKSGPDSLLCVKTLLCFCAFVYPGCYHAPASGLT